VAGAGDTAVLESRVSELTNRLSERDNQIEQLQQTLILQADKMAEQETKLTAQETQLSEVARVAGGIQSIRTELIELRTLSGLRPRRDGDLDRDPDSDRGGERD
jgi:chromosome segregation ATPase